MLLRLHLAAKSLAEPQARPCASVGQRRAEAAAALSAALEGAARAGPDEARQLAEAGLCVVEAAAASGDAALRARSLQLLALVPASLSDTQFEQALSCLEAPPVLDDARMLAACVCGQWWRAHALLLSCAAGDTGLLLGVADELLGDAAGALDCLCRHLLDTGVVECATRAASAAGLSVLARLAAAQGLTRAPPDGPRWLRAWLASSSSGGGGGGGSSAALSSEALIAMLGTSASGDAVEMAAAVLALLLTESSHEAEQSGSSAQAWRRRLSHRVCEALPRLYVESASVEHAATWLFPSLCLLRCATPCLGDAAAVAAAARALPACLALPLELQSWSRGAATLRLRSRSELVSFAQALAAGHAWFRGTIEDARLLACAAVAQGCGLIAAVLELDPEFAGQELLAPEAVRGLAALACAGPSAAEPGVDADPDARLEAHPSLALLTALASAGLWPEREDSEEDRQSQVSAVLGAALGAGPRPTCALSRAAGLQLAAVLAISADPALARSLATLVPRSQVLASLVSASSSEAAGQGSVPGAAGGIACAALHEMEAAVGCARTLFSHDAGVQFASMSARVAAGRAPPASRLGWGGFAERLDDLAEGSTATRGQSRSGRFTVHSCGHLELLLQ
jgi:hypothetical protein